MAITFTRLENEFSMSLDHAGLASKTHSSVFLSPADAQEIITDPANTPWVLAVASNLLGATVTMDAGVETVTAIHNVPFPKVWGPSTRGIQVVQYTVFYSVGVATLTSAVFTMDKVTLPAATASAPTGASVPMTGTELLTVADHLLTRVVTTPEVLDGLSEAYNITLAWEMKNTGTLTYYGTRVKFELV